MFWTAIITFLGYYTVLSMGVPVVVYPNSHFNPGDMHYVLGNLSSVSSANDCLCTCFSSTICYTVTYYGNDKICILFFAQLSQGQLQVTPTDVDASVYSFGNRSNNTAVTFFKVTNETVYAIWNTTAGGNSVPAVSGYYTGSYWPSQSAQQAFDDNLTTDYTNHGACNYTFAAITCGEKTGFYLTMHNGPMTLLAFYMASASWDRPRDPLTITIEGSNLNGSLLTLGSSWTLIYNSTTGLATDPGREAWGMLQVVPNSSIPFASYRLLVTSKAGVDTCAGYNEVQFAIY